MLNKLVVHTVLYPSHRKLSGRRKRGKKRCTSKRENHSLERIVGLNLFINLRQLYKEWTEAGVRASRATTHRRITDTDVTFLVWSQGINRRQHQKCLTWTVEEKVWTVTQWSEVIFTDESMFCISFVNQDPRV